MQPNPIPTSFALLLDVGTICLLAQSNEPKPTADNSLVHQHDQNAREATAEQQKLNSPDRDLSAKVRRSLSADNSLSLQAHNVKLILQNAIVTLKAPVRTDLELKTVLVKTVERNGNLNKTANEIAVAPTTSKDRKEPSSWNYDNHQFSASSTVAE
jgi:hyperosmotically inducible periplasmic protein